MTGKKLTLKAKDHEISLLAYENEEDFISLTDIAKQKSDYRTDIIISNWLRNRNTIEFLGVWEKMHNPNFNPIEFDGIKSSAGLNSFILTPKNWIETTSAIGIKSKAGRYGGTYAHKDIAFEFASWLSPEFKLYIIKDYQRLRYEEKDRLSLDWNLKRELSKANYKIHTDAIQEHIINIGLTSSQIGRAYATEADLLNMALFGKTKKEWSLANPDKKGNARDYASATELLVMANLESINAQLIADGLGQAERLEKLNSLAKSQLKSLLKSSAIKRIENK